MIHDSPAITLSRRAFDAVIFDLDGVITRTAEVHAAAWKCLFDDYLAQCAARSGEAQRPFDPDDYRRYVDGKPRYEGVRSFLESRGIDLPYGDARDPPEAETVCGLGNRKNRLFLEQLNRHGVRAYETSLRLVRRLRAAGLRIAIVSSSRNCAAVLEAAGISAWFDARVDGVEAARLALKGKPDPDIFLEAARRLNVAPARAVVVEDAIAGVRAGRAGGFGRVIGVDRTGQPAVLAENGADVVVTDLAEVEMSDNERASIPPAEPIPPALDSLGALARRLRDRRPAVFLDYDGTLTPIVQRPELAVLDEAMRDAVRRLARRCTVAIVSGRDLRDVQRLVGIGQLIYAGSHGFEIAGPYGRHLEYQQDTEVLPVLDRAQQDLETRLAGIDGALVERKRFSIAIHYRLVADGDCGAVERAVDEVRAAHPELRKTRGKKIYELQPDIDWNKGRAVRWLLEALDLDRPEVVPLYIGDDVTDEDAFQALRHDGIGIVVTDSARPSAAHYRLRDPDEVKHFFESLIEILEETPDG